MHEQWYQPTQSQQVYLKFSNILTIEQKARLITLIEASIILHISAKTEFNNCVPPYMAKYKLMTYGNAAKNYYFAFFAIKDTACSKIVQPTNNLFNPEEEWGSSYNVKIKSGFDTRWWLLYLSTSKLKKVTSIIFQLIYPNIAVELIQISKF